MAPVFDRYLIPLLLLQKGKRVVIADLERHIMDVSAYRLNPRQLSNNEYKELVAPTGFLFVTSYHVGLLKNSLRQCAKMAIHRVWLLTSGNT
jgi:hypothetical protein